jgi:hypothetical protein
LAADRIAVSIELHDAHEKRVLRMNVGRWRGRAHW